MIEGELDECALAGDLGITEDQYRGIVENKTAVLLGACCRIGAILGLASPEEEEAVASYGLNLGMTFQIVDDLLDLAGDQAVLGKPVLSDLAEGRITLPLIRSLQTGGRNGRKLIKSLVGRKDISVAERRGSSTPWPPGTPSITPARGPANTRKGPSSSSVRSPNRRPGKSSAGWPSSASTRKK